MGGRGFSLIGMHYHGSQYELHFHRHPWFVKGKNKKGKLIDNNLAILGLLEECRYEK